MISNQRAVGNTSSRWSFYKILAWLQWVALAAWLGSMLFLSFIGAPAAFKALDDTHLAGEVVSRMLDRFYLMSYGLGGILVITTTFQGLLGQMQQTRVFVMIFVLLLLIGINGYSREIVASQIKSLRQGIERIDVIPVQDPRRVAFEKLHRRSVQLMGGSIVLGLVLIYLGIGTSIETREINRWRI